jgi:hypothetical protein
MSLGLDQARRDASHYESEASSAQDRLQKAKSVLETCQNFRPRFPIEDIAKGIGRGVLPLKEVTDLIYGTLQEMKDDEETLENEEKLYKSAHESLLSFRSYYRAIGALAKEGRYQEALDLYEKDFGEEFFSKDVVAAFPSLQDAANAIPWMKVALANGLYRNQGCSKEDALEFGDAVEELPETPYHAYPQSYYHDEAIARFLEEEIPPLKSEISYAAFLVCFEDYKNVLEEKDSLSESTSELFKTYQDLLAGHLNRLGQVYCEKEPDLEKSYALYDAAQVFPENLRLYSVFSFPSRGDLSTTLIAATLTKEGFEGVKKKLTEAVAMANQTTWDFAPLNAILELQGFPEGERHEVLDYLAFHLSPTAKALYCFNHGTWAMFNEEEKEKLSHDLHHPKGKLNPLMLSSYFEACDKINRYPSEEIRKERAYFARRFYANPAFRWDLYRYPSFATTRLFCAAFPRRKAPKALVRSTTRNFRLVAPTFSWFLLGGLVVLSIFFFYQSGFFLRLQEPTAGFLAGADAFLGCTFLYILFALFRGKGSKMGRKVSIFSLWSGAALLLILMILSFNPSLGEAQSQTIYLFLFFVDTFLLLGGALCLDHFQYRTSPVVLWGFVGLLGVVWLLVLLMGFGLFGGHTGLNYFDLPYRSLEFSNLLFPFTGHP